MSLAPGIRLGAYEIVSLLGAGGMGEVYRARDTRLNRDVAIKVLPELFAADADRLARFKREAQLLASLNHPHIAAIYGLEETAGSSALVLELVAGPTLADRIAQGRIPLDEALPIAKQIAEALEAAHELGIIHRDLKPANIKLTSDGSVKVLDFGLAKAPEKCDVGRNFSSADLSLSPTITSPAMTIGGVILGTAAYMSPEQARGNSVDRRTDIWAFGCVLYEMLTGKAAFGGDNPTDVIARVIERQPDFEKLPAETPPLLQRLLRRCLDKNPGQRFQHIGDVRIELGDLSYSAAPAPVTSSRWRAFGWIGALAVTVGIALTLAVTTGLRMPRPRDERPALVQRQLTANPIEVAVTGAAISPDGRYVAYTDPTGLYLRVIDTGETSVVKMPEPLRFAELTWLPDGTRLIATGWSDLTESVGLYSISIFGGTPKKLRDGWRPVVSPDGKRVAFLGADWPVRDIWIMGLEGENPVRVVTAQEGEQFWQVGWAPGSNRLAYGKSAPGGTFTIGVMTIDGGLNSVLLQDRQLFQNWRGILPFAWLPDNRIVYARRELPPNQYSSNLWTITLDSNGAAIPQSNRRVTDWPDFNLRDIRATSDGKRLTVLRERNQPDVYIASLSGGSTLGEPRRITYDDRYDYPRSWTADSAAVLFESNRGSTFDLFAQNVENGRPEALVTGPQNEIRPHLSPDGKWLLFQHAGAVRNILGTSLMRVPIGGGPSERVLTGDSVRFACAVASCVFSEPRGRELIFRSLDPLKGAGSDLATLRMDFADPGFANWALSPDGKRAAVVNFGQQIQIVDFSGKGSRDIVLKDWTALEFVDWAARGDALYAVAYSVNGPRLNNTALLRVDLNGTVRVLRHKANHWHVYPTASPDGRHLAFALMILESNAWMVEGF